MNPAPQHLAVGAGTTGKEFKDRSRGDGGPCDLGVAGGDSRFREEALVPTAMKEALMGRR